jgi:hypothetical protein
VVPPMLASAITWLGYTNSCINPCVYAFLNRDFRIAFKRILSCGGKCSISRRHANRANSRYRNAYCDIHRGSGCHCEVSFAPRRHSSSSSEGRTPSQGSHERFKIEMRLAKTQVRTNGYKVSRSQDQRIKTEQESPLTGAVDLKCPDKAGRLDNIV